MSEVSEKLKEQGNMCFKKGNIVEAMNFYEEAVNLLNYGDTEDFKTLRGVLFSNLALCLLKLSDWVGAIQACDVSLLVDGGNIKAKLRKLQALYELDRYEDFLELFCEINASIPDCAKLSPLADVCKVVCKQRQGIYDLMSIAFDPALQRQSKVQSYIGPLDIRETSRMGRGLFVTRKIKAGELLLAEMATVNTSDRETEDDSIEVENEWSGRGGLLGYCDWCDNHSLRQVEVAVKQVQAIMNDDLSTNAKLSWLYRDNISTVQQTPNIRWFLPSWHPLHVEIPIELTSASFTDVDVRAVLQGNQFGTERVTNVSMNARDSLTRTLSFLYGDMAVMRNEEQTLQPVTALQSMIIQRSTMNKSSLIDEATAMFLHRIIKSADDTGEINIVDHLGCTALHYAVMMGDFLSVKELLSVSISLNVSALDRLGFTALHYVAGQHFDESILRLLLSYKHIEVNMLTYQWQTPLAIACECKQPTAVQVLLERGADPTIGHPYPLLSECPLDTAIEERNIELLRLFAAAGYNPLQRISTQRSRRATGLGLWLIASFCNHSQEANTVRVQIGDLMLIYANSNLSSGQEIFISYSRERSLLKEKYHVDDK